MQDRLGDEHELTVPAAERHGRGQYFTPFPLIELVLELCAGDPPRIVMDPACGSGRFLMAARQRWPGCALRGLETDPVALGVARENLPGAALDPESFLTAAPTGDVDLLVGNPPYVRDRGHKRDVYVDFLERAAAWLRPGGRVAFVLSSAWLDVGYGRVVRRVLADGFAIEWLVESSAERWFPGAKVNTMVLVARREDDEAVRSASEVRFATVHEPLPATPIVGRLRRQGLLSVDEPWGLWHRAPQVWLDRRAELSSLGAHARIHRGFTTNANRFFYPPADAGIEPGFVHTLLKSPKRFDGVRAAADELPDRVFVCPAGRDELHAEGAVGALAWIDTHDRGEERRGWQLSPQVPSRLFLVKGYGDRFRQPVFDRPVYCDQQLYQVRPRDGVPEEALAALMNSSWFRLSLELVGRVNFGDGVLWLGLEDARRIPIPDPAPRAAELVLAFSALPDGKVPPLPQLFDDPSWAEPMRALDGLVAELVGLSAAESSEVATAARALCERRLRKAASGRNPRRDGRSK